MSRMFPKVSHEDRIAMYEFNRKENRAYRESRKIRHNPELREPLYAVAGKLRIRDQRRKQRNFKQAQR